MSEQIYKQLARRLDSLPNGFPATEDGAELRILKKLVTPQEAELTTHLRLTLETPKEIAARLERESRDIKPLLKDMSRKGLIKAGRAEHGLGYGLLLSLIAFLFCPVSFVVRKRPSKLEGEGLDRKQSRIATIAIFTIMLTIAAILVLSLLYRGPLGGGLVHSLNTGETVLTKALLGLFFSTPIILVVLTFFIWKKHVWSFQERLQYSLLVLGALAGVWFLRDLWGLMFWG